MKRSAKVILALFVGLPLALVLAGSSINPGSGSVVASLITTFTGTGTVGVLQTSPTLITPVLGVAAATSVNVGDGSAAVPAVAFTSDADGTGTGLYRSGTNEGSFVSNGVVKVQFSPSSVSVAGTFAATGGVTISTLMPLITRAANLTVAAGTSPNSTFLRISSTGAVGWTPGSSGIASDGAWFTACNVDAESDAVTMTNGGTYAGSGVVLGINDCVTAVWDNTTLKWRQTATSNN